MSISVSKYCKEYSVKSYEADCHGYLRLLTLMNILQDIACENADVLGFGFERCREQNLAWVGANYLIKINRLPRIDEHFTIETWPSGMKMWGGVRDFNVKNENGEVIAAAISQWVLIDCERRRPVILSKHFPQYNVLEERALNVDFAKTEKLVDFSRRQEFVVRFDDIDVNNHVNNAVYPLWASECLSPEFRLNHIPEEIELCFKKEALYGEIIEVFTAQTANESRHSICKKETGEELAECRFKWRKITLK